MPAGAGLDAVPRPRLAALLERADQVGGAATMVAAIGGSGFGKSVFIRWLATAVSAPAVLLELDGPTGPEELVAAVRRAARRDGLSDFAAALTDGATNPGDHLRFAVSGGDPVTLVVDEVGRLDEAAAQLLADIADGFIGPGRLLVAGRTLPEPLRSVAGAIVLTEEQLAFDPGETASVLQAAAGEGVTEQDAALVFDLTGGWPAGVAVAAARLRARRPQPAGRRQVLPERSEVSEAVRALACLPLLSESVAQLVTGSVGLQALSAAGVPVVGRSDGWVELAEPVRERLADEAALPPAVRREVATAYAGLGRLGEAVNLLGGVDDSAGIAELMAGQHYSVLEQLGLPDLRRIVDSIPDDVFAARPEALFAAVRASERIGGRVEGTRWLQRAVLHLAPDHPLRGSVEAELARSAIRAGDLDGAVSGAELALSRPSIGDRGRGRALVVLGSAAAYREDPEGLRRGAELLAEAVVCLRRAGDSRWEAEAQMILANGFDLPNGRVTRSFESASRAVSLVAAVDEVRATYLTFLSEILCWVPDLDGAEAALTEADAIVARSKDDRLAAYVQWAWAQVAGRRGDAVTVRERVAAVLRHQGPWYATPAGLTFHGEMAELLAACHDEPGAREQVRIGESREDGAQFPHMLQRGRAAIAARFDNPVVAGAMLTEMVEAAHIRPIDRPRMLLLAGWSAQRAGDNRGALDLATAAFASAATLDHPAVLEAAEPQLAAWAAELLGNPITVVGQRISVLGGMTVTKDGVDVTPPPGLPQMVLGLLAVSGAQPRESLVDLLWPEVDLTTGLSRLRNLLNRIRAASGEIVRRRGVHVELGPGWACDLWDLRAAIRRVDEADGDARFGLARQALVRWTGPLLPAVDDEWVVAPREEIGRRIIELLDEVAQMAWRTGDLDEAVRHLERGIELAPYEEIRYVRLGRALLRQGRRGAATDAVRRGIAAMEAIGVAPGPRLVELQSGVGSRPAH